LVTGTAEKVLVDEGQMVKKGQLLAILNNESYQNMYRLHYQRPSKQRMRTTGWSLCIKKGACLK